MTSTPTSGLSTDAFLAAGNRTNIANFVQLQASVRPEHPACIFENTQISYRELLQRIRFIAVQLEAAGVQYGDRVGVLFPNHPDYVASFFAITGLGAVVVPINPLLKSEEIAHILGDSKAKAIIVHERALLEVTAALPHLVALTHIFTFSYSSINQADEEHGPVTLRRLNGNAWRQQVTAKNWQRNIKGEQDLALLVYTSGTTGKPKGAMLTFKNLYSSIDMAHDVLAIAATDRALAVLPLCHIYGLIVVLLGMISNGGTIVLLEKFEAPVVLETVERERVTLLPAVPAIYQFLTMELEKKKYDLSSLRCCVSGAAPLAVELLCKLEQYIKAPLIEGYGLTEITALATVNPIFGVRKKGSVGIPCKGVELAIVAPSGDRLASGRENVGEVAIKGPNVMRGYFEQPEATAQTVRHDWLFTGDLGYLDDDGYLFIVGRSKELIIRGGQNIYPKEIEDVIARMPAVAEVAVIGVPDQFMGERVKAVVALRRGTQLTEDDIKQFCAQNLAEYKVPRLVSFVEALPRNSTGKVLKRTLQTGT